MSNDRNHDQQISAAYQRLAKERAPEHLDQNVLRMARANTERPQYSRWMAWSRPLAWAATVALCLAITLEVTQVTAPDDIATEIVPAEIATPASVLAPGRQKDKREQMSEQDMDQQLKPTESASDSMADAISSEKIAPARGAAKQAVSEPAPAGRMRQSAGYATSDALAADMPVSECSDEARSDPEGWLECIDRLEAAGDTEAALQQRKNLAEAFPDFKLP